MNCKKKAAGMLERQSVFSLIPAAILVFIDLPFD